MDVEQMLAVETETVEGQMLDVTEEEETETEAGTTVVVAEQT